jgi:hypothetical protein
MTFEDSLCSVSECFRQENNFYINLRLSTSILSSKIIFGYCFAVTRYLEIKIQRKQSYIWGSGTQRIKALLYNDWHFLYPEKEHFVMWAIFWHRTFWVNFGSHKLLKAVFDVSRCTLSDKANREMIPRVDLTELPDLDGYAFLGW